MKYYRIFDTTSGIVHPLVIKATSLSDALAHEIPGHSLIEGEIDHLSQRVDIQKVQVQTGPYVATAECLIDYQPPQPSSEHEWNSQTRRWSIPEAARLRSEARTTALARIRALEDSQHRPLRELTIDPANVIARQRLQEIESQISSLREQLQGPPILTGSQA